MAGDATTNVGRTGSAAGGARGGPPGPSSGPSAASLAFLQALIARRASIEIGSERRTLWISRLNPVAKAGGLASIDELVAALQAGNRDLERDVVDAMTTNETMFFRDGPVFESIVTEVLPAMIDRVGGTGRVTIWSGASSSGQEVYSLAMLIDRLHPELVRSGRVRILASDLSTTMVERTRAGRYSTLEARRGLTDADLGTYFERDGDHWVVGPRLKRMVLCRQLNLMDSLDPIPRCEIVLLRNVLIYFSDHDRLDILRRVKERVLRPDGALVLGSSELIGSGERFYTSERLANGFSFRPRR
ncbi:MAG: protein-glutamate O-methyltransferase CheR [Actinomycetota bacterium]